MQSMLVHDEKVIINLSRGLIIGFVCQTEIIDVHGLMVNVIMF